MGLTPLLMEYYVISLAITSPSGEPRSLPSRPQVPATSRTGHRKITAGLEVRKGVPWNGFRSLFTKRNGLSQKVFNQFQY